MIYHGEIITGLSTIGKNRAGRCYDLRELDEADDSKNMFHLERLKSWRIRAGVIEITPRLPEMLQVYRPIEPRAKHEQKGRGEW